MEVTEIEKQYYGDQVDITYRENDCSIYRLEDNTGSAVMTRYEVFPGIALVYNDVHKQEISIGVTDKIHHIFEINHCREGRIEFESMSGEYMYIKKGDMAINTKGGVQNYSYFPLSHYHGVTIEIDFKTVDEKIPAFMKQLQIDTDIIKKKFCRTDHCFVFRENKQFEHLFAELYSVPEKIRKEYYKIKVMEILLFMTALDVDSESVKNKYYNKNQVAVVKEIRNYIVKHLDEKITIDQLAQSYQMSSTNIKKYFKEVYGNSIYAYIKAYRIQTAADLLKNSDLEIGRIAGMVGYDNASKFAGSFKSILGINPNEYRKSV